MTTLIYRDGVLSGDRRYGMPLAGDQIVYVDRPKVHLHPSGKIAYGICGSVKGKDAIADLGDYLLSVAVLIEQGTVPDMKPVLMEYMVNSINIILLTRKNAWLFVLDEGDDTTVKVTNLDDLPYYTVGSGQWAAAALLGEGVKIDKIYDIVPLIDGMTGPKFDVYKKTKLKSLGVKHARSNKGKGDILP